MFGCLASSLLVPHFTVHGFHQLLQLQPTPLFWPPFLQRFFFDPEQREKPENCGCNCLGRSDIFFMDDGFSTIVGPQLRADRHVMPFNKHLRHDKEFEANWQITGHDLRGRIVACE